MYEFTQHDYSVCAKKRHYASKGNAEAAARRVSNRYGKTLPRAYLCPVCGSWALATDPVAPGKDRKKQVKRRRAVKTHKTVRPYKRTQPPAPD